MNRNRTAALRLENFETPTSRFLLLRLVPSRVEEIVAKGALALGHKSQETQLWEQLLAGDLIICVAMGEHNRLLACRVIGKSIAPPRSIDPVRLREERPFLLLLDLIGETLSFTLKGETFFFGDAQLGPPRHLFQQLWEQCQRISGFRPHGIPTQAWLYTGDNNFDVRIASSAEDHLNISQMAEFHPFGARRAFLSVIAYSNREAVGAMLIERGKDVQQAHRAAWRIFRHDYPWIRNRSIDIVRIYTRPTAKNRFRLHRVLLESILELSPALVEQPLSIIQGVSYNYHPLALELGFHVEIPRKIEDSFFYWRSFNAPTPVPPPSGTELRNIKKRVHEMLANRRKVQYWLAYGRPEHIEIGLKQNMWAIRKQQSNTGRWASLHPGNVIFLLTRDHRIRAYGTVASTQMKAVKSYEQFPLLINFESPMTTNIDIEISNHITEHWYKSIGGGGIIPLPDEFGAYLKAIADEQRKEGKMWVEPNPYLLHKTDFEVVPGQVFVVQAWDLRETVYPIIKSILEPSYRVTYSGDRDGQLVFEDIWLMLNESEAVLVDFTYKRPNVYLEFGMALVLGKPIIAITQTKDDIPSDTPNLKFILYQDKLGDQSLRQQLPRAISDIINDIQVMKGRRRAVT